MKTHLNFFLLILLIALTTGIYSCSEQKSNEYPPFPADHEQKLEWWKDARFGMFIHWGPVSLKGTEIGWSRGREIPVEEYDSLYLQFNPANDDQTPWVEIDLEKPEKISKFILFESGKAINAFDIQYLKDNAWETAYAGNSVENGKPITLPEITAQKVRLVLNEFSSVPGIYEFIIL